MCLNPRSALCSSSVIPLLLSCLSADLFILVTECLITGRGHSLVFVHYEAETPPRPHSHVALHLGQHLYYSCPLSAALLLFFNDNQSS